MPGSTSTRTHSIPRGHPSAIAACLILAVTLVAGRGAAPVAGRVAGGAPRQSTATHQAYLPVLARAFTWASSSLDDPYAPGMGNPGYEVTRYDLHFHVSISESQPTAAYDAVATIAASSTQAGLRRLALDYSGPPVTDVRLDDAPALWSTGAGNKLWVELPRPLGLGEPIRLRFAYAGAAGSPGGLAVARAGTQDAQLWVVPGTASAWFPANDHPGDPARFRFSITAPKPYVSVANGRLLARDDAGDATTAHFETAEMAPGDATLQIAKYTLVEGRSKLGLPLRHYLLRPTEQVDPVLAAFERLLDYHIALVGPYPYDRFGIVESGALDSASVQSLYVLGKTQQAWRPLYVERLAGSGVARQWFGGAVGMRSRRDAVLNAGLALYLNVLFLGRDQGPEIEQARMANYEVSYSYTVGTDWPLTDLPTDIRGSDLLSYEGPWAFRALRLAIGHESFVATLRSYFRARQGGFADLDALQRSAEGAAGRDLTDLFDATFRLATTPRANVAWVQEGDLVRLRICQLTTPPRRFPLEVALHGAGGAHRASIAVSAAEQVVELPAAGQVAALTPDPDQALLADLIVHPAAGSLPACADLPAPALPAGAPPRDGAVDVARTEPGMALDDLPVHDHHKAPWLADPPVGPSIRPGAPIDGPGEPSIGDPYLPDLGNTGYDVQHYAVKMTIDPDARRIEGDTTLDIRGTLDGLDRLSLDFMNLKGTAGLTVLDVGVDGTPAPFERPTGTDKLWITLPAPMPTGAVFSVRVRYAGTPVPSSRPPRRDLGLGFHSGPMANADAEPDGTRSWIPVNDHPRDKATYHFEITVPKPYVAVANGTAGAVSETATATTYPFDMPQPMASYLATVAVAKFRVARQTGPRGIPITHYFLNDPQEGMRVAGVTPEALEYYSRLIGPYPFDSYGHYATTGVGQGGAMENQTMTRVGATVFSWRTPRSVQSTVAHEALHQWFGDALSLANWSEIWLNEGFARYFDRLWLHRAVGPEPLDWAVENLRWGTLAAGAVEPLNKPSWANMFGTNAYSKGAAVLHMLRHEIGEEAFWAGIRGYYQQHLHGVVSTDDLQAAMEAASGRDLDAWFAEWVHRAGNPLVLAAWHQSGDQLGIRLCQSGEPFDLPITVAVHGATQRVRAEVTTQVADRTVQVSAPFDVIGVTLDPDFHLLADLQVQRSPADGLPTCAAMVAERR